MVWDFFYATWVIVQSISQVTLVSSVLTPSLGSSTRLWHVLRKLFAFLFAFQLENNLEVKKGCLKAKLIQVDSLVFEFLKEDTHLFFLET